MKFSPLFKSLGAIFRPPFAGLAVVVWLYFVWTFIVHPHSPILRADFIDPDDPMCLAQILDWVKGQSWFDIHQYRMDPPDGMILPFSRFSELPVALLILPLHYLGLPWVGSAIIAAAIWPLVLLGFLFMALRWVGQVFMPRDWAGITAYVGLFATSTVFMFTPGHVDHTGISMIITLLAFGCVTRMIIEPDAVKWGVLAGFLLAFGQTVALETLPWLLAMSGWVCAWMIVKGRMAARSGLAFGLMLYVASALFLVVTQYPSEWFVTDSLRYSVTYVLFAGGIAIGCCGIAAAAQSRFTIARYLVGVALVGGAGALFFTSFPEMVAGPYGAMNKQLADLFFNNISEALPLARKEASIASFVLRLMMPLMGFGAALYFMLKAEGEDIWCWKFAMLISLAAIMLAGFYQARYTAYAMLFAIVPLSAYLRHALQHVGACWRGRKLAMAELGLLLLAGPMPTVLLPAVVDSRPFNTGVLLFPVQYTDNKCDTFVLEQILNAKKIYGDRPRLVMNMMDLGPEILFRTQHSVLAGGYHYNVRGNLNSVKFFSTTNPDESEAIARERNVDLVIMCRQIPAMYLGAEGPNQFDMDKDTGKVALRPTASFAEQLIYGKVPNWLERKNFSQLENYLIYEVKPKSEKPEAQ